MDKRTSAPRVGEPTGRFGLRLALWYSAVFVATSLAIVLLTYTLLASSLEARDRQIITLRINEYSQRYVSGGLGSLAEAVEADRRSGREERLFVRVINHGSETLFFDMPP